jgi:hypothetical protein
MILLVSNAPDGDKTMAMNCFKLATMVSTLDDAFTTFWVNLWTVLQPTVSAEGNGSQKMNVKTDFVGVMFAQSSQNWIDS